MNDTILEIKDLHVLFPVHKKWLPAVDGVNLNKVAKASLNVKPGDIIEIQFGNRNTKVEVLSINETYKKDEAKELYRYV